MKRTLSVMLVAAAALFLGACTTKPTSSITDGKVTNLRSHEATTLVKADIRSKKVEKVIKNYKPIFEIEADGDKPITITAKRLTVNVPLSVETLLAESRDVESEAVQMADKVVQVGEKVIVPIAKAAAVAEVFKRQSDNAKETAIAQSAERTAQTEAMAGLAESGMDYAAKPPLVLQVPMGSSHIPVE